MHSIYSTNPYKYIKNSTFLLPWHNETIFHHQRAESLANILENPSHKYAFGGPRHHASARYDTAR
jgi:hypothetical protein